MYDFNCTQKIKKLSTYLNLEPQREFDRKESKRNRKLEEQMGKHMSEKLIGPYSMIDLQRVKGGCAHKDKRLRLKQSLGLKCLVLRSEKAIDRAVP